MSISVDKLSETIVKEIELYMTGINKRTNELAIKNAKEGVKMLKKSYATKKTGEYNSGWRYKKVKGNVTIHNYKRPELTHLLEHGHAKVNGGRVGGIPHISLVEKQVVANFEKDVEKAIADIKT